MHETLPTLTAIKSTQYEILKSVANGALSHASQSLMKNIRESIKQELADHGRRGKNRGGGLMLKRSQKMVVNRKRKPLH